MTNFVKISRLHLVDHLGWIVVPSLILLSSWAINLVIWLIIGEQEAGNYTGGLAFLPIYAVVLGCLTITKTLHFAFALSLTRRAYYLGTFGTSVFLGAVVAAGTVVLARIESATNGWGVDGHYFRIPWILDGPWYQDFLVMFTLLTLFFTTGMLISIYILRFGVNGFLLSSIAFAVVVGACGALITLQQWWDEIGRALGSLTPLSVAGVLAGATVAVGLGGFATIRRLAV